LSTAFQAAFIMPRAQKIAPGSAMHGITNSTWLVGG